MCPSGGGKTGFFHYLPSCSVADPLSTPSEVPIPTLGGSGMLSEDVSSKHHSLAAGYALEIQTEMRPCSVSTSPPQGANSNPFLFSSGVALPRMRSFHRSVWAGDMHHQHFPAGGRRGNFMGTHLGFGPLARPHIIDTVTNTQGPAIM